ncbi:MAG: hydantoinase B/oxoprolinase family protein [Acidobacteriota bacterium]
MAISAADLELFTHRFGALAAEMGEMLRRTAISTNVKERLDFSCALLDASGSLVVNAPHIPVHLGALGECVRRVRAAIEIAPGDVVVTNHPGFGGSHLPDVTVLAPVNSPNGELLGWVANRAHHAEIGGKRPGSMPPDARCLAEEGVVLAPFHLLRSGEARWQELEAELRGGPFPSRSVEENLADLNAALAAVRRGQQGLERLAGQYGGEAVRGAMAAIQERAAQRMRDAFLRLEPGRREARERLDDGSELHIAIDIAAGRAHFDFTGTSPVHPGNLNMTPAIVRSVVLYVLRLLAGDDGVPLPLNEGLLADVDLTIPAGTLLNPDFSGTPAESPAVVGGNVETSQRLVDTLLKALGLAACSQGTMNNTLFGNAHFGFYETVCGGCGAGPGFDGASAVHSHMTNTRITDPEVLEHRYPVRLERFAVRRGSGGAGQWRGGDGVVREITFLEPMSLSVLTQHRRERPYGVAGGGEGEAGRQRVIRASGEIVTLGPVDGCEVFPGDRLVLETPGGGGWGAA